MSAELIDLTKIAQDPDVLYVYSGADIWLEQSVGGNPYRFCPYDETWPTKEENAKRGDDKAAAMGPGVSPVRALTCWEIHKKQKQIKAAGAGHWPARVVLDFLLGDDRRSGAIGKAGVRPMTGNAEIDEQLKAEARKQWLEKKYFDAINMIRTHETAVAKAASAGTPGPEYTKRLAEAYKDKAEYERAGFVAVATHPCPVCNAPHYTQEQVDVHLETFHNQKPAALAAAAPASDAVVNLLAKLMEANEQLVGRLAKLEERKKPGPKRRKPAEAAAE